MCTAQCTVVQYVPLQVSMLYNSQLVYDQSLTTAPLCTLRAAVAPINFKEEIHCIQRIASDQKRKSE